MELTVNFSRMSAIYSQLQSQSSKLNTYHSTLETVLSGCVITGSAGTAIKKSLRNVAAGISGERTSLKSMNSCLQEVMSAYRATESKLSGVTASKVNTNVSGGTVSGTASGFNGESGFTGGSGGGRIDDYVAAGGVAGSIGIGTIISGMVDGSGVSDYDSSEGAGSFNTEWSSSGSIFKTSMGSDVGGGGVASVVVGASEAYSSISGGLFSTGKYGNKIFNPNIDAEVGTSYTALEADWDQQWLGDEMLGIGTSVVVIAGQTSLGAGIKGQIIGDDGQMDVKLKADLNAEVKALEAKAAAKVDVLGGGVEVTGGVDVGFGAHASVGFEDGVFTCDIGASFGIGGSLALEVDVGSMIDTVSGYASAAWTSLTGLFN